MVLSSYILVDTKSSEETSVFAPADHLLHKPYLPKIVMFVWDNKATQMYKVPNNCLNVSIKNLGAGALGTELLNFCDINLRKKPNKNAEKTTEYKFVL